MANRSFYLGFCKFGLDLSTQVCETVTKYGGPVPLAIRMEEHRPSRSGRVNTPRGFTLVELMATVAIITLLLGLLLPALSNSITAARAFKCQMALRSVVFDFNVYADRNLHGDRGDDTRYLPDGRFRLETFIENQYQVDEFWAWGSRVNSHRLPDVGGNDPLRCSEVKADVVVRRSTSCSQGAVGPAEAVSYGFNARLHRPERVSANGTVRSEPVMLRSDILENTMVPLVWDVDGADALLKQNQPVFSAPALDSKQVFANDRMWSPSMRHGGAMQVAFIDGHVVSTSKPLNESGWNWGFTPRR
jgi:prepilin-type N-terminal cleavage/methylation domain-containing protein/prepilin-type processing-associated H-X9-DG protein